MVQVLQHPLDSLVNTGQPNLRTTIPLSYDQRHAISASVDYRYKTGDKYTGPVLGKWKVFEDAGAKVGLAGVDMDNDMVVRYHPTYENTLAGVPANLNTPPEERSKIINYAGPDHFFNFIS